MCSDGVRWCLICDLLAAGIVVLYYFSKNVSVGNVYVAVIMQTIYFQLIAVFEE